MGYPLDLDEIFMENLRDEIARREKLFENNKCPYCIRTLNECSENPCKMANKMVEYMGNNNADRRNIRSFK